MQRRKEWIAKLKSKDIVLFCAGNYAKRLYRDYCDELSIVGCISNNPNEEKLCVDGKDICTVFRVEDYIRRASKDTYYICAATTSSDMESQLWLLGLIPGLDFCSSEMARLILSEKKIAVLYGVCYMRAIHDCLKKSMAFMSEYEVFYSLSYMTRSPIEDYYLKFRISLCDLYMHNFTISPDQRKKQYELLRFVPEYAETIAIPIIQSAALYPQAGNSSQWFNPYGIVSSKTRWGAFTSPDHNINRLLEQGITADDILEIVKKKNYYEPSFLEANYNKEMLTIEMSEFGSDILISDYIKNNRGKKRLFINETHISNEVIIELTRRILDKLRIVADLPREELLSIRLINATEVPLYPSVIKGLGLEVYEGNPVYLLYTFSEEKRVSFEEYVKLYCDFCGNMMRYKNMGYFP